MSISSSTVDFYVNICFFIFASFFLYKEGVLDYKYEILEERIKSKIGYEGGN